MIFRKLRETNKALIIFIAITFVAAGAFVGITSFLGGKSGQNVSLGGTGMYADSTLLTVNGEKVLAREFFLVLENYYNYLHLLPTKEVMDLQNSIIFSLIERSVMGQEANRRGIKAKVTEEEILEVINEYLEDSNISLAELEKQLAAVGDSLKNAKSRVKEGLTERNLLLALEDSIKNEVNITAEDVINEYEKVKVSEIFIEHPENDDYDAYELASAAWQKVKQGLDIESIVNSNPSIIVSQDLGFFNRNSDYNPAIVKYAFNMEIGETSEIIATEDGYHILVVEDRIYAQGDEFEEAKKSVEEDLLALKQYQHFRNTIDDMAYGATVEIHNPALAGYYWYRKGNFQEAVKQLASVTKEISDNSVLIDILANAYFLTGNGDKAFKTFEDAIKAHSNDWELRLAYADFSGKLGDYDTAEEQLQIILEAESDNYDMMENLLPYINRLGSQKQINQIEEIIQLLEEELEAENLTSEE